MPVYLIVEIKTKNENKDAYAKYVEKVSSIVEKHRGQYLSRGGKVTPVFGNCNPERIIIIEFPSARNVEQWFNSPEYKEIAVLKESSTITKAIMVEGCNNGK